MDISSFKQLREALQVPHGSLYEDHQFPCDPKYDWIRPKEMLEIHGEIPVFLGNGASRFDMIQGKPRNCWAIVAAVAITQDKELFERVVPPNQDFESDDYCGAFYFKFQKDDHWTTVIIDDRLPFKNDKLTSAWSLNKNKFWGPLLEKAYVKFCETTYDALGSGKVETALLNFTGGSVEHHYFTNPNDDPLNVYDLLRGSGQKKTLMTAVLSGPAPADVSSEFQGLDTNHAYNVLDVLKIEDGEKEVVLLRIRNPQGPGKEWTGDWCDGCEKWKNVTLPETIANQFPFENDGEFWMEYDDFCTTFHYVELLTFE